MNERRIVDTVLTKMDQSSITNLDSKRAVELYGHPLTALEFISADLERMRLYEWTPSYKREPKHLIGVLSSLKNSITYNHPLELPEQALIPAARSVAIKAVKLPKVEDFPEVTTPVEQAYKDYLEHRIQIKKGRWRYHFRSHRRNAWNTNLCDYDKDPELRRRYPLEVTYTGPPDEFREDAVKWQDDFQKPQEERRRQIERAMFRGIDKRIAEFVRYCHGIGIKDVYWYEAQQ